MKLSKYLGVAVVALGCVLGSAVSSTAATAATAPQAAAASGPSAAALLAKLHSCKQVSHGTYHYSEGTPGAAKVCAANGAIFYTSSMAVDCDGQATTQCNRRTDYDFQNDTMFHEADGKPLNAAALPYVVLPTPSSRWNYEKFGITGGAVVAMIYRGHVEYGVFGDTGPTNIIGEASYASAKGLGIDPNPDNGGANNGVTYIVFENSKVSPIQDHGSADALGASLAKKFLSHN